MRLSIQGAQYATWEANVEAEGREEGGTGVGSRWVLSDRRRRIRGNRRTNSDRAGDEHSAESGSCSRRRGNFRRQSGNILCFRQGKLAGGYRTACQRRLRRL